MNHVIQRAERRSRPALNWLRWGRARAAIDWSPTALQARYLGAVLRYVAARLGPGDEADDATADVFVAAFDRWRECPSPVDESSDDDPVRAWLFGIARRKVADALRRRIRRPTEELDPAFVATGASPDTVALADEAAQHLRALISSLPDDQAEALRLKYVDELSLVEIGRIFGRSPAAVGALLHRARASVRARDNGYFTETETNGESVP